MAQAFVADGQAYNWTIQRERFASFEPILDFVHASEHVHHAAKAVGEPGERWVELCWQGRAAEVLDELDERLAWIDPPENPAEESEHPWSILHRERGYRAENQQRMDYPRYRRAGLPITSSPIESWIKQMNRRIKGSEKFWNDDENVEAILALRAAWLGDDDQLKRHLESRPGSAAARPRKP
jgi:hypothetical protein